MKVDVSRFKCADCLKSFYTFFIDEVSVCPICGGSNVKKQDDVKQYVVSDV